MREIVERIIKLSPLEIKQEVYRRQKELLVWRRRIRLPEFSKRRSRRGRKKVRAQIRWRAQELLAITDALNMHVLRVQRDDYQKWQAEIMEKAMAEVNRMELAGEVYQAPDKKEISLDEQLFKEREATRN